MQRVPLTPGAYACTSALARSVVHISPMPFTSAIAPHPPRALNGANSAGHSLAGTSADTAPELPIAIGAEIRRGAGNMAEAES